MIFKVLHITTDIAEYPDSREDTEAHPELIKYVDDEMGIFIMDEDGHFWEASDFFMINEISKFEVIE